MLKELATRMVERGYQVVCYDPSSSHVLGTEMESKSEYKGVKIVSVWTIKRKSFAMMTSSLSVAWKASRSKVDVVYIHAEGPAAMCWLPKLRGKRVIVTIHGLCGIIGSIGENPVKSRIQGASVFYPNLNTEYQIKNEYSGFLKRFCFMPEASRCTCRTFFAGIPLRITYRN